jgi:hypothetical protein
VVIPPIYRGASFSTEGLAAVRQGNFWGAVDLKGNVVIPFVYELLTFFNQGVIRAQKDGKWGYINTKGQTVIDFVFDDTYYGDYPEGIYLVSVGGKEGLIDKERNCILEPIYERVYPGTGALIGVQKDGKVGFVDHKGRVVIDFQYQGRRWPKPGEMVILQTGYVYTFSEGLATVRLPDSTVNPKEPLYGVINEKGELLFQLPGWPQGYYSEGFLLVNRYRDKKMGLIDTAGKWHSLPSVVNNETYGSLSDGTLLIETTSNTSIRNLGYLKIEVKE